MGKMKKVEHIMLVWAYQELKELENRVGFVTVPEALALKLLASEKVQDPKIGSMALKPITYKKPKTTKATPKNTVNKTTEG